MQNSPLVTRGYRISFVLIIQELARRPRRLSDPELVGDMALHHMVLHERWCEGV